MNASVYLVCGKLGSHLIALNHPLASRIRSNDHDFVVVIVVVRQLSPGGRELFAQSCVSGSKWKCLNLPSLENICGKHLLSERSFCSFFMSLHGSNARCELSKWRQQTVTRWTVHHHHSVHGHSSHLSAGHRECIQQPNDKRHPLVKQDTRWKQPLDKWWRPWVYPSIQWWAWWIQPSEKW